MSQDDGDRTIPRTSRAGPGFLLHVRQWCGPAARRIHERPLRQESRPKRCQYEPASQPPPGIPDKDVPTGEKITKITVDVGSRSHGARTKAQEKSVKDDWP